MKVSQYYELDDLDQKDLGFLDRLIDRDIPLYIDPSLIEVQEGNWFREASIIINHFFTTILGLYRNGEKEKAADLLIHAKEPNETGLGVSTGKSQGRGTSPEKLIKMFNHIVDQNLLENNLISSYNDLNIFLKDFAEDRMSDLVTNIIREKLSEFTVLQSELYGFELTNAEVNIGVSWDIETSSWKEVKTRALMPNDKLLLLVPKSIVVQSYVYSVEEYLSKVVFLWRKQVHLDNDSNLVQKKFIKKYKKLIPKPPSNDKIVQHEITAEGLTWKEYAINMTLENPELISGFRESINHTLRGTNNNSLSDDLLMEIVRKKQSESA